MLAKRRGIFEGSKAIIRTPLLLPSFSSKGFPAVQNILSTTQEVIDGEILVSAYDIYHQHLNGTFEFAEAIFLDSGGYEASKDVELSDLQMAQHDPRSWNFDQYAKTIHGWTSSRPTVIVSYDHPQERHSTPDQIARANETLPRGNNIFREILFKPEAPQSSYANIAAIVDNASTLVDFHAIGVTEKEIGATLQDRMTSIASIRTALNETGQSDKPIHIFGSLDTISTPLYFVAGADIFDGLTWLRFAYIDGMTVYRQNYAALKVGLDIDTDMVDAHCFFANYRYLKDLQLEMKEYAFSGSFDTFTHHSDLIANAYETMLKTMEAYHGR